MLLNELKEILQTPIGSPVQKTIVWSREFMMFIEENCSIEYAINKYGSCEVKRISADDNKLVIIL